MIDVIFTALLAGLGAIIGMTFADIDLAPPLPLKHRSVWTHGPLIPWGIAVGVGMYPWLWPFALGFLASFAIHLLADMFPKSWHGSSMINCYPLKLSLPPLLSFLYLFSGVVFSGWQLAQIAQAKGLWDGY